MAEHSIEELKRQWQSATDRAKEATTAESAAKARYKAAVLDATGFNGHVVEGPEYGPIGTKKRILVRRLGGWRDDKVGGSIIKKDGTPGERDAEVLIEYATDLGPYVEPSK